MKESLSLRKMSEDNLKEYLSSYYTIAANHWMRAHIKASLHKKFEELMETLKL